MTVGVAVGGTGVAVGGMGVGVSVGAWVGEAAAVGVEALVGDADCVPGVVEVAAPAVGLVLAFALADGLALPTGDADALGAEPTAMTVPGFAVAVGEVLGAAAFEPP